MDYKCDFIKHIYLIGWKDCTYMVDHYYVFNVRTDNSLLRMHCIPEVWYCLGNAQSTWVYKEVFSDLNKFP